MMESLPRPDSHHNIRAIRTGPDRLPLDTFYESPWPIKCIAYWYHAHTWCEEPECFCRDPWRAGDGICAVFYEDGLIGLYSLAHPWSDELLAWDRLVGVERLEMPRFWQLRSLRRMPDHVLEQTTWPDAIYGLWAAVDEVLRRGLLGLGKQQSADVEPVLIEAA